MTLAPRLTRLLAAACAVSTMVSLSLSPSGQAQTEDAAQLRNLAERLLAPTIGYAGADDTGHARLLLGQLPADFPFDLPLPPGGRVVGSAVRSVGNEAASVQVVIDAPGSALSAVEFYERELRARGWDTPANVYSGVGAFKPSDSARSSFLCQGDTGAYVSVAAVQPPSGPTDVRLSVSAPVSSSSMPTGYGGPCSAQGYSSIQSTTSRLLPRLAAPTGVQLQTTSVPTVLPGQGAEVSEAVATTQLTVAELEAYFAGQLQTEGWEWTAGGGDGPLAWSAWRVPGDEEAVGYLVVTDVPGENRRRLSVRVESGGTGPSLPSVVYMGPF